MKRFILFIIVFALMLMGCLGQGYHYYAGEEEIHLDQNRKSICLHLDTLALAADVFHSSYLNQGKVRPAQIPSTYFILDFDQAVESHPLQYVLPLLLDSSLLLHADFGFLTSDGMPLWLSPCLTYLPNKNFDPVKFQDLLQRYPAAYLGNSSQGIPYVHVADPIHSLELSNDMAASAMFHWAHPDFIAPLEGLNDPYYVDQFYLNNTGQVVDGQMGTPDMDIDAPEAWSMLRSSRQVNVAVLDNGVEAHEDLEDSLGTSRVLPGYDTYSLGTNGGPYLGIEMHGQACAGIIAALHNNSSGIRGIAQDANILPVYFPFLATPTNITYIADGIMWAWRNGADVMNNSYGYPSCLSNPFPVLTDAIDSAVIKGRGGLGTVMVFAAGNDTGCVRYPGNLPSTFTCGAIDKNGNLATYSNTGPELDVVAPSATDVNMLDIRVTDRMGPDGTNVSGAADLPDINYTRQFGGTSSATAQTTGVVALLMKEAYQLTGDSIMSIIRQTALDMGVSGYDTLFGYGRINAFEALQVAVDTVLPVLWINVEGENRGRGVNLKWKVKESQGSYFEVLRNGLLQDRVDISRGATYEFWDHEVSPGLHVYQLVWVGINGERIPSPKIEVQVSPEWNIQLYSGASILRIEVEGLRGKLLDVDLMDMQGRTYGRARFIADRGQVRGEMPIQGLSRGIYLCRIKDESGKVTYLKWRR